MGKKDKLNEADIVWDETPQINEEEIIWDESPKSNAPSSQGGGSGAPTPPTTSTSASGASSLGSWTTEANPLKPKEQPIQVPAAPKKAEFIKPVATKAPSSDLLKARVNELGDLYKKAIGDAENYKSQINQFDAELTQKKAAVEANPTSKQLVDDFNFSVKKRNELADATKKEMIRAEQIQKRIGETEKSIDNSLGNWESAGNSLSNVVTTIQGFLPKTVLTATQIQGKIAKGISYGLGKILTAPMPEAEAKLTQKSIDDVLKYGLVYSALEDEGQKYAYEKLDELQKEYKPTKSIVEAYKNNDLKGAAAGIFDGATSLLSTIATSVPTFGVGLYTEMAGDNIYNFNKEKAKSLGISVDELYNQNKDEVAVPALIGAISAKLEDVGLKGISKAINTNIAKKGVKEVFNFILEGGKEAGTEWLQTGMETYNKALGQGLSEIEAGKMAWETMTSEEGLEAALKGAAGSGAAIVGGKAAKSLWAGIKGSKKDALKADLDKVQTLAAERENPDLDESTIEAIDKEINNTTAIIQQAAVENAKQRFNLTEENSNLVSKIELEQDAINDEIESKQTLVDNPNLKPETKAILQSEITALEVKKMELATQVDEVVKNNAPIILKKNTSPTDEKYGTVNRNDGKGVVDLTKEEFLKEQGIPETTIEAPTVEAAVIEIGGKMYEGKNHAEAILKAKADGQDISQVDRQGQGKFRLSDGTIIDRAEAKKRFGKDRSELIIPQDEAAKEANKEYRKITETAGVVEVAPIQEIKDRLQENDRNLEELSKRQQRELADLNKKENKNYADAFDILNVNEYSQDQSQRSKEAIELANRHQQEFEALNNERKQIQEESSNLTFSDYNFKNKKSVLDKLKNAIKNVLNKDRQALDVGFEVAAPSLDAALEVGADEYVAHGMGKTNLANAFNDLITLFTRGINPTQGRGSLDIAPLAGGVSTGTTSSGNAYMDGAFTLVANRGHQGAITNINQIGGIIVNEGMASNEVLNSLRELFPDLIIESTSNAKLLVEQLNKKAQSDVNIQQPMGESKADVGAVGDVAKEDENYKQSREVTESVSKENPDASILITPKGNDLNLTAVYVGKEKRGQGIGSKVLESVKKQAEKLGKKVVLDATNELDEDTDLERLGKFYEKNGFEKVGENKFEYNPKKETEVAKENEGEIDTKIKTFDTIDKVMPDESIKGNIKRTIEIAQNLPEDIYNKIAEQVKSVLSGTQFTESDFISSIGNVYEQLSKTTPNEVKNPTPPAVNIEVPKPSIEVNKDDNKVEVKPKVTSFKEAKDNYDAIEKKNQKHFKKDGGLRANTPESVKTELKDAYLELQNFVKEERERLVAEDKRDTGLTDGLNRIKSNPSALAIVKASMDRGLIPERQYNEFGKNLLHMIAEKSDDILVQTAEIIQEFSKRANVKIDDGFAAELQAAENAKFETAEEENIVEEPIIEKTAKQLAKESNAEKAKKISNKLRAIANKIGNGGINIKLDAGLTQWVTKQVLNRAADIIDATGNIIDGINYIAKEIEKGAKKAKIAYDKKQIKNAVKDFLGEEPTKEQISEYNQRVRDKKNKARAKKASPFTNYDGTSTGVQNMVAELERIQQGKEPIQISKEDKRDWKQVMKNANDWFLDADNNIESLIQKLKDGVPPTAEEVAVMTMYKVQLDGQLATALEQKENFFKNGKGDIVAIDRNISKISEDLDNYYEAARRSAYEQGLSFNMRKLMLNNDYSLAQTLRRAKAAGGNELIPNDVKKKLEDLTAQVAKHAEEINKLQEQAEKEKAQAVLDAIKATQESKGKGKSNESPKVKENAIKEKADKAVAALEKFQAKIRANRYSDATLIVAAVDTAITVIKTAIKAGGNISAAIQKGIDSINETIGKGNWDENRFRSDMEEGFNSEGVEVEGQKGTIKIEDSKLKVSQGYLENLVKNGYDTIDKMVEFIQGTEDGKDLTERQIRDGISKYGETTHPPSDKIKEAVSIAKGEGRLLSALEDVTGGKRAQHSGFQRRPPTDRERRLAQEIYDKNKLIPQDAAESQKGWATALDRAKKALKNRIADLSNAIDTETKIQRENKVLELDKEGIKLKHKKNFKQAIYDELFKEGVTDEQRIESAKKSILDYKKKLESGDLSTKAKEQRKTENAELDALWKELDDLKKELQRRKSEAKPKKSESDILKDRLFAEIGKYSEAILNNERIQRNDKNRGVLDAELQNLENAKELVKEMYKSHFESEITAENDLKKIEATQKSIDNLADKLANNDLSTKAVIGTTNPKLQSLRDSLKDLNKQLAKARAASNAKTPLESLKISLQRDIDNLNDALNGNAQLKAAPQNIPLDAQAQAMIDEKEQLKGLLDGLKQPKSDKQKMEELTDYYEKQSAQLDKDLSSLNIAYRIKQQFNETPELKAAKKKFADLKKVRDMMRELTGMAYANDVSIREKRNESTIKKLEQKLKDLQNGIYKPIVRKEQVTSAKIAQQQKDMAYKKYLIEKEINKQEWASRPKWKKTLDAITGYYRAGVLSGIATVEKLMGYGIMESHIVNPLKNMTIGQVIRYIPYLKDVNEKAGVERVGSLKSEISIQAKMMTEFYSKETWKDTWNVVKTGKSKLDLLHGDLKDMPPEVLAVIQHTHKALKNPTVRALFQSHLEKTLYAMQQAGQDTSNPEVMEAASKAALIEAYNSILLGKNELSKQWNSLIRGLELAGKDKNEGVYMATSTAAAILRILEPVSTVPVNFMNKAISYHPAIGLSKAAITSISRGVKGGEMTQQEAASMIRNIKSAGIGAAIYAVGYLLPQLFGGVDDDDEKETGLKKGKIKGISKALTHHPIFELAHVAASHRRLNDKSNSDFISGNSAWNAFSKEKEQVGELMENTPFFSASISLVEMFKDDRSMKYLAGNTVKNLVVPMMVQNIAKYIDEDEGGNVNRRKTDNLFEYIQSGIPVYRNKLINKDSEAGKKGLTIEDMENKDVINFNNKVKADGFTENQVEEMTAEYAKGIKDYNKLIEKGLVKESLFQKKALAEDILKEYLKEGEATKEEKLIDRLSKAATPEQKAVILKNEFYYKPKGKETKVVEPLQTQENKIKRLLKKGVIDKKDEEMFYRVMVDINKAAKIKK